MKNQKDKLNLERCLAFLKIKAIDYNVQLDLSSIVKLEEAINNDGLQMDKLTKHITDTVHTCLVAQGCSDVSIEKSAIALIDKAVKEFMDLTDTPPGLVEKLGPKDLFEIADEFTEDMDAKKVCAYALNQYIIEPKSLSIPNEPLEVIDTQSDVDDEFELEEEEEEEIHYVQ